MTTYPSVPASRPTPRPAGTDWACEQRVEILFSATIRCISLGSSSPTPDDLFDYIPSTRRPLLSDLLSLTTIGQLHTTDDETVGFAHRPHATVLEQARAASHPLLTPSPTRLGFNVDALVGPAHVPLHHLLPLGCFLGTPHDYVLLFVDWY